MSRNQKVAAGVVGVGAFGLALWLLFRPRPVTVVEPRKAYDSGLTPEALKRTLDAFR